MDTVSHYVSGKSCVLLIYCSGGNQRELARQKNAKKQAAASKAKGSNEKAGNKGAGLEQRRQRDADIMRDKQKKAAAEKK